MFTRSNISKKKTNTFAKSTALAATLAVTFFALTQAQAGLISEVSKIANNDRILPLETIELACEFGAAKPGEEPGFVRIINHSENTLHGGLPVTYRLTSTGEEFTFHMPGSAEQWEQARVEHRLAVESSCTAWTYVR
ncbi:MAG: hypothetical protein ACR2OJ_17755 [Hyphomicrobiales bacterium]